MINEVQSTMALNDFSSEPFFVNEYIEEIEEGLLEGMVWYVSLCSALFGDFELSGAKS